jgi:hypothetical protein
MNENEENMLIKTQFPFPKTVKIGRSEYVIERHFTSGRTVTDAVYDLLRVENELNFSEPENKLPDFSKISA